MEEVEVEIDDKKYRIKVVGEVSMVSRNLNYKTSFDEPVYWVHWGGESTMETGRAVDWKDNLVNIPETHTESLK